MTKMLTENNQRAFFELLKAGLWEMEARLSQYQDINYAAILQLAEEQSVVGLVTAGLEYVQDVKVPQEWVLQFIGSTLQTEQQNKAMNEFVARLIDKLRKEEIYAILVKGQGIAQCYERPLWRASGDVDLLLSDSNYEKAKKVLLPFALEVETEFKSLKHLGMTLKEGFEVELHGFFHSRLSNRIDCVIDKAQNDIFWGGQVRSWQNGDTLVFLPAPDSDVIIIFTHILKHFYIEGVGIRQICDWCRLLWTYRDSLNRNLLESRIREAGMMSEWLSFAALAVQYLGMPESTMPLFGSSVQEFKGKAVRIMEFVLESGNFGHNREMKRSGNWIVGKCQAALFKMKDFIRHARLFPLDSVKFFFHYAMNGVSVIRDQRNEHGSAI